MEVAPIMVRRPGKHHDHFQGRENSWVPSPDEIRRRTAEIRRGWSPQVRREREMPLPGWPLLPLLFGIDMADTAPCRS